MLNSMMNEYLSILDLVSLVFLHDSDEEGSRLRNTDSHL